jgi:hypothetical protein
MNLRKGDIYTRGQIHRMFKGELETYLPQSKGVIVCGCFDPELNPQAPEEVLVGIGPNVYEKALLLCEQGGTIPVFVKQDTDKWKYAGDYMVQSWSEKEELTLQKAEEAGRKVSRVIYLEEVA